MTEPLTDFEVGIVTEDLKMRGFWYPPDAIRATDERRDEYVALDGKTKWVMTACLRGLIGASLDRTRRGRFPFSPRRSS